MARILIVEESHIYSNMLQGLLKQHTDFNFDFAFNYSEVQRLLKQFRYDFAVADLRLDDAPHGQIITLLNRHNIAPIILLDAIDEDFHDTYESSNIVDYVLKEHYDDIANVTRLLMQLQANRKKNILLIDATVSHSLLLKQQLMHHQFRVVISTNVNEAYQKVQQGEHYDLVAINNSISQHDQLVFISALRKEAKTRTLPLISFVEDSGAFETAQLLKEGLSDYIIKPFSRDELYHRIYNYITPVALEITDD